MASMPELFEATARAHPRAPALASDEAGVLSFAELNAVANQLAHLLIATGAGPERVVGVALPRSVEAIVAIVAVFKTGAAYLPLNPDHPPQRLAPMVADAAPIAVLVAAGDADREPTELAAAIGEHCPGTVLDWSGLALDEHPDTDPVDADRTTPLHPAHPLYLIYTSGSTGVPKGVAMPSTSLVNLLAWHASRFPVGPGTRTANLSAIGFDFGMHEILAALVHGKCLVVPTEEVRCDPIRLAHWLDRHAVHQVFLPNVLIESLCAAAAATGVGLAELVDIVQSGERLVLGDGVREFLREHRNVRIHNHYGATEMQDATTWSSGTSEVPTIGTALWNVRVYVLDEQLRELPDGAVGELYVAGVGLARGYLGRPGLTASRYLPDPFGAPGSRMYHTGDLARRNVAGELECLGRSDNQVKINGFRVELAEIEALLRQRDGVRQAVVLPRTAPGGDKQLVGYVVGADPDTARIRVELAGLLPGYMVPAAVLALPELPIAANGKVDLRALPAPEFGTTGSATGRPADTPEQQTLLEAFAEVLGVPAGADDDFVGLGGDSLGAVRLVTLAGRGGLSIGVREVFELGSPRRLAAVAAVSAAKPIPVRPLVALHHHQLNRLRAAHPNVTEVLPVTPVQQGFLFHWLRAADSYTEQLRLVLTGEVDASALRAALAAALRRHAPLRAAFLVQGVPEPLQVIVAEVESSLPETDLSALDRASAAARAEEIAARSKAIPFDLHRPPLLRMQLIRLPGGTTQLVLDYHHLLLDGWSVTLLVRELLGPGTPVANPPRLRDWLRVLLARDRDAAAAAWREALHGTAPTVLTGAASEPAPGQPPEADSARYVTELPAEVTARLVEVAQAQRLTMHTVLLACWGVLLAEETGADHAVFGSTTSGRMPEVAGVDNLVAMLVNTVPVAVTVQPGEPRVALLRRVRAAQLAIAPHQHLGLGVIRRLLSWDTEFDTLLAFENQELQLDDPRIIESRHSDDTHYAVSVLVTPGPTLRIAVTYRPRLIGADRVARLAEGLTAQLTAVAEDPRRPIGEPGQLVSGPAKRGA